RTASRRSWIKTLIVASAYFKGVEDSCARELQRDEEFPLPFRGRLRDRRPGPAAPLVVLELPPHFGAVVALCRARRHRHRRTGVRRVGDELLPGQLHDLGEGGGPGDERLEFPAVGVAVRRDYLRVEALKVRQVAVGVGRARELRFRLPLVLDAERGLLRR